MINGHPYLMRDSLTRANFSFTDISLLLFDQDRWLSTFTETNGWILSFCRLPMPRMTKNSSQLRHYRFSEDPIRLEVFPVSQRPADATSRLYRPYSPRYAAALRSFLAFRRLRLLPGRPEDIKGVFSARTDPKTLSNRIRSKVSNAAALWVWRDASCGAELRLFWEELAVVTGLVTVVAGGVGGGLVWDWEGWGVALAAVSGVNIYTVQCRYNMGNIYSNTRNRYQ